jgi:hypothetical protein
MYNLTNFEKELNLFANRVDIIVGLEMGKKITAREAYKRIKASMKTLKESKKIAKEQNKNETDTSQRSS